MNLSPRALAIGSFFLALAAVGVLAYPALAQDASIDFWNVGKYHANLKADQEFRVELDRSDDIVLHRVELREEIVRDVVNGRMPFDEAAARFALLNRGVPDKATSPSNTFPGRTEEEKAAWQLVCFLGSARGEAARQIASEQECILIGKSTAEDPSGSSVISE